ncbi:MAG TPA: hypothetical protein VGG78_06790 [Gemmatimonadaceae bacterium]
MRMPRLLTIAASALSLFGCNLGRAAAPPSGLPVSVTFPPTPTASTIVAGGADSVTLTIPSTALTMLPCGDRVNEAGVLGRTLVITLAWTERAYPCAMLMVSQPTVQVVVHQVPPGQYQLVLTERYETLTGSVTESDVVRSTFALP